MSMLKVIDLRGGTKSEAAFGAEANIVQKMQTATGGKVSGDEWNNFAESGGNAAKKLRTDAFYYQMQPLIEKLGGKSAGAGLAALSGSALEARRPHSPRNGWRRSASSIRNHAPEERCDRQAQAGRAGTRDMLQASPFEWLERCCCRSSPPKGITAEQGQGRVGETVPRQSRRKPAHHDV